MITITFFFRFQSSSRHLHSQDKNYRWLTHFSTLHINNHMYKFITHTLHAIETCVSEAVKMIRAETCAVSTFKSTDIFKTTDIIMTAGTIEETDPTLSMRIYSCKDQHI